MSRKDARERAFQLLYQLSVQAGDEDQQIGEFIANMGDYHDSDRKITYTDDDIAYIQRIVGGYRFYKDRLDQTYAPFLKDWTIERLAKVDLAILRLATSEIMFMPDVPLNVTINEAVLLSKRYAASGSRAYINAVLGRLSKPEGDVLLSEVFGAEPGPAISAEPDPAIHAEQIEPVESEESLEIDEVSNETTVDESELDLSDDLGEPETTVTEED